LGLILISHEGQKAQASLCPVYDAAFWINPVALLRLFPEPEEVVAQNAILDDKVARKCRPATTMIIPVAGHLQRIAPVGIASRAIGQQGVLEVSPLALDKLRCPYLGVCEQVLRAPQHDGITRA